MGNLLDSKPQVKCDKTFSSCIYECFYEIPLANWEKMDNNFLNAKLYKNILQKHLDAMNSTGLYWATRPIKFRQVNLNPVPSKEPKELICMVSTYVQNKLKNQDTLTQESAQRINMILNEIGYEYNLPVIRWLGWILNRVLKSSLDALHVSNIESVLCNNGSTPVVLLPTHRSYADFILLAYIAFCQEIELPCVAAGMDFHSMFLMGNILRKCKAFYMKRRFNNDPLYKMVFNDYLRHLLIYGNSPVEFFIEGTRSRSSKALPPKYGLLSTVVDTFLKNEVVDVNIVPVSLVYDKLLEEKLFAYEHLGIPKPKESTWKLFQALQNMNTKYGSVYVAFGQPISLRSCITRTAESPTNFQNKQNNVKELTHLGTSVMKSHKELSVTTLFNLIATIAANHIIRTGAFTIDFETLYTEIEILMNILTLDGATFNVDNYEAKDKFDNAVLSSIKLHENLFSLDNHKGLQFHNVYNNASITNNKDASLDQVIGESLMQIAIPRIMLQLYINPLMVYLANPGLLLSLLLTQRGGQTTEYLKGPFIIVNHIFSKEFVPVESSPEMVFQKTLSTLEKIGIVEISNSLVTIKKHHDTEIEIILNALAPFLTGYFYAINVLLSISEDLKFTQRELIKKVQSFIATLHMEGNLKHLYSLSLDLLNNAVTSFINFGALVTTKTSPLTYQVGKPRALLIANTIGKFINGHQIFTNRNTTMSKL